MKCPHKCVNYHAALVGLCYSLGGPDMSKRNVEIWDEALDAAKTHQDIYLQADVCRAMGRVAKQIG